jgi:hypothetical protein
MAWTLRFLLAILLFSQAAGLAGATQSDPSGIEVTIVDSANRPVPGVLIQVSVAGRSTASAETDEKGRASFPALQPAKYEVSASKEGFETVSKSGIEPGQSIQIALRPAAQHESVNVTAATTPVEAGASAPSPLPPQIAKQLPGRPANVAETLPMVPGVVRAPDGALQISASAEHRSALIVNSADVTDPATGQFGLTVPIDSVESINVFQTPYLAEYGRFTAGLVSVETRRGGDKWKWEINDPFPDFYIRSYHLRGLRDATPRLNAEGPIIKNRLFFSEGLDYEVRKVQMHTLPFPKDQKITEGFNSFAQLDWIPSDKHLVTGTVHVAPQRIDYANLDYFNPQPTTPDASTHNYTATLSDKWTIFGGVLENMISRTEFGARVWPLGPAELSITPGGNSGNYFEQQARTALRYAATPSFSFAPMKRLGLHEFKLGAYFAESFDRGQVFEQPINIFGADQQLIERITFFGGRAFHMDDTEYAVYGEDHWILSPRLALDLGIRTESQAISESFRVAPRAGVSWTPFAKTGTVIRAGFGWFYDRVPLNVYSFNHYPKQILTYYNPDGSIFAGPFFYENSLGEASLHFPFVFSHAQAGNFSPQSATGSVQIEQPLTRALLLRIKYMQNQSQGLVIVNPIAPDPTTNIGAYELRGDGVSRYRQLEMTARLRLDKAREIFFSYVRGRARGDLNDFGTYLGSFPSPIIRPNRFGNLPADIPNRFLAWGSVKLPNGFAVSPVVEYRNGFPYLVLDGAQNYVGVPNQNRYRNFLSFDSRLSKDIKVSPKYTVQLSITDYNLTNHFNPEAFHNNIADPAYGLFFGQRGRRFTADFDILF